MPHAEATAADWLELAAESRAMADDPRCPAECREYHERAAMDYEVEAVRRLMAERDTAQRAILDVRIALSGKGILPFSNGLLGNPSLP